MRKKASLTLVFALLLSLGITIGPLSSSDIIIPVASGTTVVRVNPSLIEYRVNATGQQFTINVTISNVTNLYGFDLQFRWNTNYLAYVNRSVYVPCNASSPYGVLWSPVVLIEDQVNTTTGTYWIAYASMYPASSFNGSGTVFKMTFSVIRHPVQPEPDASITLDFYSTDLSNTIGDPIPHTNEAGTVKLYALPGASAAGGGSRMPYLT
jgi:hypothetical protein